MKNTLSFIFIFFSFSLLGQEIDTNKSIFSNSSEYRNYQEHYLSNLGQAKFHLTSPFQLNNNVFRPLFPSNSNTNTYTDVFYVLGSGRENYIDLEHHQQLGKDFFGEAKILKTNSEGIYINQQAQLSDFRVNLAYKPDSKRYGFKVNFNNYKRFAILNGGTSDSSFFALLDSNNGNLKSTFPTNFNTLPNNTDNSLDLKVMHIDFSHYLDLKNPEKDSINFFRLSQEFSYDRTIRKIELLNTSDFFDKYLYDSVATNDSLKLEQLSHRFSLDYVTQYSVLSAGIGQNYYEYESRSPFETHLENLLFARVSYKKDNLSLNTYGEFMISENGYESFEFRNNLIYENKEKIIFQLFEANVNILTDLPELYWNRYDGNHVSWNNVNRRNGIIQANLNASNPNKKYGVSIFLESQSDAVVFDSLSVPTQTNISLLGFSLHKEFWFTKWLVLSSHVHVQDIISGETIEVPNFLTYNKLHFRGRLIKKVLTFDAGINVLYYTNFTPRSYNPSIDEFFVQTNQQVGNYPVIDLFAEFYIKKNFSFFTTVTHVNSNVLTSITSKNYLVTSNYPIQDRAFKFGLKWRLFD